MSVTVLYSTEAKLIKSGGVPATIVERQFESLDQAKAADLPENAVSASIRVEGGHHVYSHTGGWEYHEDSQFQQSVQQFAQKMRQEKVVNWNERKDWWRDKVSHLLDEIERWLTPLKSTGAIGFARSRVTLDEEQLGSYQIEAAIVTLGHAKLRLQPIGTVIIGGFGRIDLDGPKGKVMLLLATTEVDVPTGQRRENATWFISYPQSRRDLRPLHQQSFEKLFSDLFGISE